MTQNRSEKLIEELEKQLRIDETLVRCVRTLYEKQDVESAIDELLSIIAEYHSAERAYIFEIDEENSLLHNTYEWCRAGVEPQIDFLQDVDIRVIERWMERFENDGEFFISSLSGEVDKDSEEYEILKIQAIDSLMAAPLRMNDKIVGFLGVDNPAANTDTLLLLRSVAAFVINDIQKRQTVEQQIIGALAAIYVSMHFMDLEQDSYRELHSIEHVHAIAGKQGKISEQLPKVMSILAEDAYMQQVMEFIDINTLEARMADNKIISSEFLGRISGWCRVSFIEVSRGEDGHLQNVIFAVQQIDEQKRRELEYQRALKEALENKNEMYMEMLHMQSCGFIAAKVDGAEVSMMNVAALKMFGWNSIDDFDGKVSCIFDRLQASDKPEIIRGLKQLKHKGQEYVYECTIRKMDGGFVHIMVHAKVVALSSGEKMLIQSLTDITEKKVMEDELLHLSQTDGLTGISNRSSGESKIERLIAEGVSGMFCLLDVDKFKLVNDTYGHNVGDQVLIALAECLKKSFRSTDVIMRLGGDEYAVYAVGITDKESAGNSIDRFFAAVNRLRIPALGEKKLSVSLGAVLCDSKAQFIFDSLYQMADSAMYQCKKNNGNMYKFYEG